MMTQKASIDVGYTKSDLEHYAWINKQGLQGADITAKDGKGNIIEVNIRAGDIGYRVRLNGKEIAEG